MGDMFQLEAIGTSLCKASVLECNNPAEAAIGELFNQFRIIQFHSQMRASADPVHAQMLSDLRTAITRTWNPVTAEILSRLKVHH